MDEILDWIFADARREFLVQSIFCAGGVLAVVYGLILQIRSKLRHEVLPREFAGSVIAVRSRRWGVCAAASCRIFPRRSIDPCLQCHIMRT